MLQAYRMAQRVKMNAIINETDDELRVFTSFGLHMETLTFKIFTQ